MDEPNAVVAEPPAEPVRKRRGHPLRWAALVVGLFVIIVVGTFAGAQLREPQVADSPLLGKPGPAFDLPALDDGGRVRSLDYVGEVYVVNFWASWCVPCLEEAPVLQSFYERWSPRGVTVVGILVKDTAAAGRAFRDEFRLTYPQAVDADAVATIDFGVRGLPETFVVDERGIVMAKLVGGLEPGTLEDVLATIEAGDSVTDSNERYQQQP